MKKTYLYSGPPSGVTLSDGTEVLLYPGKTRDLPDQNEYVQALIDRGLLTEVPKPDKAPKKEAK